MNDEVYWYFLNGHLKQHLNPPSDPSSVTFATIRTNDIGYKQVRAEVILCIEGTYLKPKIFTSSSYHTPKQFREIVENYVKESLTKHRGITDWTTQERKNNNKKSKVTRCKKK
jgi:hypothetical protein